MMIKKVINKQKYQHLPVLTAKDQEVLSLYPCAALLVNASGKIIFANDMASELFGYDKQALLAMLVEDLIPERFRKSHVKSRESFMMSPVRKNMSDRYDLKAKTKNQEERDVIVDLNPILLNAEPHVICSIVDVSKRVRYEQDMQLQIREIKSFLENIFSSISNMLIVLNPNLLIIMVNKSTLDNLGYREEELLGKPISDVIKDGDNILSQMNKIIEGNIEGDVELSSEKIFLSKDHQEISVLFSTAVYRDDQNKIKGIVCVAQDITELKAVREQLLQSQKLESIGMLAGGIAHDFNNMLAGITGNLTLLKMNLGKNPEKTMRYILSAEKAAKRSADLVQQLLWFARKGQYKKTALYLNDLLIEVRTILYRSIDKTINIELILAPNLWIVEGDSSQLLQVFLNMGLNARDAMPEGGKLLFESKNLTVDTMYCCHHPQLTPGDYVCITVSDTGVGMEPDQIKKVFDPFYTTKEQGKGTGLGLSTAYGVIHKHSGVIIVYSELGRGTIFNVYLPRFEKKVMDNTEPANFGLTQRTKEGVSGKSILVVDDEKIIREVAKEILETQGMIVTLAKNGIEAIEFYKKHVNEIDLVVLDVTMPIMDGVRVFHELKKINPDIQVIFSSGNIESDKITKIKEAGESVQFIQKPFNVADFVLLIKQVLQA